VKYFGTKGSTFGWLSCGLVALVLLGAPLPAFSQGCALCYTQAAASGAKMIEALRSGILILVLPPTLGSLVVIRILYRKRNQFKTSDFAIDPEQAWYDAESVR
jgi:hypothetical protein